MVFAGTDLDEDGFICDEGEFCGAFPVSNQPSLVGILVGENTSGVRFTIEKDEILEALSSDSTDMGLKIIRNGPVRKIPRTVLERSYQREEKK